MMIRALSSYTMRLAIGVIVGTATCFGACIETQVLQYKLGRFYLSSGTEENVFAGSRFGVVCDGDTVHRGCVEYSLAGISITDTSAMFLDTLLPDSCHVFIEAADIDSVSTIGLRVSGNEQLNVISKCFVIGPAVLSDNPPTTEGPDQSTTRGNALRFDRLRPYEDPVVSLQLGECDGFLAYRRRQLADIRHTTVSSPAPYLVVLVPNISRQVNRGGVLTTSLYYRFHESRLPVVFEGDNIIPMTCFRVSDTTCDRPFPHDPAQGRKLLQEHPRRPPVLRLAATEKSLSKLALYFADILSRDRIDVEMVRDFHDADVFVAYVPLADSLWSCPLAYVRRMLLSGRPAAPSTEEILYGIDTSLERAREADNVETREYYCRLAERKMLYDLGVFPLFRPTVFFYASERLKNCRFNDDGYLDVHSLTRLRLPTAQSGTGP